MTNLRARLAEVLALINEADSDDGEIAADTAARRFVELPDLDRALEDAERLEWLERVGFATNNHPRSRDDEPSVHSWRDGVEWKWTATYRGSEFSSAREAIDAARKKP